MGKPFDGDFTVQTGWRYSNGAGHFAYDYPMPIGTPLHAVGDGRIAAASAGILNDEDDPHDTDYSGEPSNWVLLWTWHTGRQATVYYQHMSPNLKVRAGQPVHDGDLIGFSGDSGNTSGPHLHIATMWGHTLNRYLYMDNDGDNPYIIFPPSRLWKGDPDMSQLTKQEMDDFADQVADKTVRRLLAVPLFGAEATKELRGVTLRESLRATYLGHDERAER